MPHDFGRRYTTTIDPMLTTHTCKPSGSTVGRAVLLAVAVRGRRQNSLFCLEATATKCLILASSRLATTRPAMAICVYAAAVTAGMPAHVVVVTTRLDLFAAVERTVACWIMSRNWATICLAASVEPGVVVDGSSTWNVVPTGSSIRRPVWDVALTEIAMPDTTIAVAVTVTEIARTGRARHHGHDCQQRSGEY